MTDAGEFNLEALFSSRVPEPAQARVINRAKYDFAIAYPDPETVPTEALAECVRDAVAEEGRDLAIYPHDQGLSATSRVRRPQAGDATAASRPVPTTSSLPTAPASRTTSSSRP